jgi:hypothetical protein
VYDPVIFKALLIKYNWKHFTQAKDTPSMNEILGMIPFSGGMGPVAESVLDGTITVDNPVVQLVLDNLKCTEGLKKYQHRSHLTK